MNNRIKAPVMAVAMSFALTGCGLLDVDNPNSLVEESIKQEAAANGVANGSFQLVGEALSDIWEGPAVASDELYWIGSRDAWGQLDQGFIKNNENEFTDSAFPQLGTSAWMAQNAVEILTTHFTEGVLPPEDFRLDLGRAYMFRGMILMVTAEVQSDMTFSNKMVDGPPVSGGAAAIGSEGQHPVGSMEAVMDLAIASYTTALTYFTGSDDDDIYSNALALRARAHMSRAIMAQMDAPGGALARRADPRAGRAMVAGPGAGAGRSAG